MSSRQLAAIMFADIVGYTGMMQEDEVIALELLMKLKKSMESVIDKHRGRLIEFRGDGALIYFSSTLESVQAALTLQLEMQTNPPVPLRIGLHTGDVIVDGDSIYGDGVNIASRMESFAVPGSIFISGRVREDIKNRRDIQTLSLGRFILKNVKDEVEIFAINHPGIKIPDVSKLEGKGEKVKQKSILVLPFINLSRDPEQEYFSDGLTEELISNLLRLKDMRVISRTTSMKYKGAVMDIKSIRKETSADYIMEGSVRKYGNDIRITAQFIDACEDKHVWAESYTGTLDNIFDFQEKVSAKIVEALRLQLTQDQKETLQKRFTENTEAYQLYLQGRFFWNKRNQDGLNTSIRFFENAIQKDPEYALAWTGLADAHNLLGEFTNLSRRDLHPKAKAAVDRALAIDPMLAEAHISLASVLMLGEWNWEDAGREYRIGIELNPNYATGHHWYAEWLLFKGLKDEALREISLAAEIDPISQAILKDYGITLYYCRQYDSAIEKADMALDLDPNFISAYRLRSLSYQGLKLYDKAIEENERWGTLTGNETKTKVALANILATAGRKEEALLLLDEILTHLKLTGNDYRGMAHIYAALGDNDKTFEWLDKSVDRHEESLISILVDPKFDSLHSDPRFDNIVRRLGIR